MNLEDQVCSLELAQKLKELGFKQESLFYWVKLSEKKSKLKKREWGLANEGEFLKKCDYISAYTVAELGIWLKWIPMMIFGLPDDLKNLIQDFDTEANFRARCLIYSKNNKLI